MSGGIAILLGVIILVVAVILGIALYLTGGALWAAKPGSKGSGRQHRPEHKEATSPTTENTEVVGAEEAVEERRPG